MWTYPLLENNLFKKVIKMYIGIVYRCLFLDCFKFIVRKKAKCIHKLPELGFGFWAFDDDTSESKIIHICCAGKGISGSCTNLSISCSDFPEDLRLLKRKLKQVFHGNVVVHVIRLITDFHFFEQRLVCSIHESVRDVQTGPEKSESLR